MATSTAKHDAALGFEDKLWAAADMLRNNMDPAEYKHVVLGLIFLKYIYDDQQGFCRAVALSDIAGHDYVLTPGRYVGAEEVEDDGEPFDEKMDRLVTTLREQQADGQRLDAAIGDALRSLGWEL
jgi:type I restriction-modification system DNA methylase subunit